MTFIGISRRFSLADQGQYDTIGRFWDEMSARYGLERLVGLGYRWSEGEISYAIGLKEGVIEGADFRMILPDEGWTDAFGLTDDLPALYDEIYRDGPLDLELEAFTADGTCHIRYYRK